MAEINQLYCTFRSAGRWFGVPIEDVKEVTTQTTCTRIPHAPEEVAGYVNIRGHIILALDLRRLLGLSASSTPENRLIILKQSVGHSFGVLVDEIGDIVSVDADQVEEFERGAHQTLPGEPIRRLDLITLVCRLPAELLVVVDPRKFLRLVEQSISAAG
ncbi:MAG: chemotaxis protein CheW [Isosphaeraceae bacterium]